MISQFAFVIVLALAAFFIGRRVLLIRKTILLGKAADRSGDSSERFGTMMLVAFGQQKMFKRFIPAFLHFFVYAGFLVINLEVLEFVLDGLLGTHRLFLPLLGDFYFVLMNMFEFLAIAVLVSCVFFLTRRNLTKVSRFKGQEMKRWPNFDANLILVIEIILMCAILTMNATDQLLTTGYYAATQPGDLFFSSAMMIPLFQSMSEGTLHLVERGAWWFHIIGIFAFAYYVTYSKHLHIGLAFPNTWFSNLKSRGAIANMPIVTQEVRSMLEMPPIGEEIDAEAAGSFGAQDIKDLTWVNLMNSYSCTECGRCTDNCPANQTGRKLSPRKIMMDTRDRCEEVAFRLEKNQEPFQEGDKTLLDGYISREEINACTTCNACVEACPVNIDPLDIIVQLRRYIAMEESATPAQWTAMFSNIETSAAPWKFAASDRDAWMREE